MKLGFELCVVAVAALLAAAGCSSMETGPPATDKSVPPVSPLLGSPQARQRIEQLRTRFRLSDRPALPEPSPGRASLSRPVVAAGVATGFAPSGNSQLRAIVPGGAKAAVLRPATVELPLRASGDAVLEDDASHVAVRFRLRDASDATVAVADGIALYPGALAGSDVIHRVHAEGTEDYIVLEQRPAREEIAYDVDVSRVAGLRLVSNTLEFLDETGAPRLRIAPPYVVETSGARREATLAVEGCRYDTDASAPWGRPVTQPGRPSCAVRVAWATNSYPAIVDPSWTATGSMAAIRYSHTATLLGSGRVLVAGGYTGGSSLSSAELFDGTSSFAATGSMTVPRYGHTATLLGPASVLIVGGVSTAYQSSAELYNGASFAATGSMAETRTDHTATRLTSGQVLIAGGRGGNGVRATAELFDGTSSFSATGSMTAPRFWHTATRLSSGQVLIAGGVSTSPPISSAELFDGISSFSMTGSMTSPRVTHTATLLSSGKVLIVGGSDNIASTSSAELFDGTSSFGATGSMTARRSDHRATLLPSGKVLVTGGRGQSGAEVFDGSSSFGAGGLMTIVRWNHTATLLSSGRVLVAGGTSTGVNLSSAELFDEAATGGSGGGAGTEGTSGTAGASGTPGSGGIGGTSGVGGGSGTAGTGAMAGTSAGGSSGMAGSAGSSSVSGGAPGFDASTDGAAATNAFFPLPEFGSCACATLGRHDARDGWAALWGTSLVLANRRRRRKRLDASPGRQP
jgi:hypothetical protein